MLTPRLYDPLSAGDHAPCIRHQRWFAYPVLLSPESVVNDEMVRQCLHAERRHCLPNVLKEILA
jgi:hypothetical protein